MEGERKKKVNVFSSSFYSMSVVCQQNAQRVLKENHRLREISAHKHVCIMHPIHTHSPNVCHSFLKIASYKRRKRGRDGGEEGSVRRTRSLCSLFFLPVIRPNYGGADAWQPQSCSFN